MKKLKINKNLLGFYFYKYRWYALCFFVVFLIGILMNKFIETIFMLIGFRAFRYVFPGTLHIEDFKECIYTSIFCLSMNVILTVNKNISIYGSLLISFTLCLILYIIDYVIVLIKPKEAKRNRDRIIEILNGDTSKEHILLICRNNGLKEDIADTVDHYLNTTIEKASEKLNIDTKTVQRKIKRFIEKF